MKTNVNTSGFIGYRSAMEFHGLERELFMMYMIQAQRDRADKQSRRFGVPVKKFKPMVYGKSTG